MFNLLQKWVRRVVATASVVLFTNSTRADVVVLDDFSQSSQSFSVGLPNTATTFATALGVNTALGQSVTRSTTITLQNVPPGIPPSQFFQFGVSGTVGGGDFRSLTFTRATTAATVLGYTFSSANLLGLTANIWLPNEPGVGFQVRVLDTFGQTGFLSGVTGGFVPGTGLTAPADYSVSFAGLSNVDTTKIREVDLIVNAYSDQLRIDDVRVTTSNPVPAPSSVLLVLLGVPFFARRLRRDR